MRTVYDVLGQKHIPEIDIDIYPQDIYPTQSIIDGPHCIKSVMSDFCQGNVCTCTYIQKQLSTIQIYAKCLSFKTYPFSFFMRRIVEFASEDPHNDLEINSGSSMIEAQPSSFNDSFLVVLQSFEPSTGALLLDSA